MMNDFDCDFDVNIASKKVFSAFNESRHVEDIKGNELEEQTWRMKERMKTVSVALVMCLNLGVDPPDIIKTQPCAKFECWVDPVTMAAPKALETIGTGLQKQYERWQPRARYKQSLDPTVEDVKRLCISLRRSAKDERVLFHYNGHGVPKPTVNGEIWAFNKSYTQYIPLSVYDLQQWMGVPSIYVYDCSCAGQIIESFNEVALQHEREYDLITKVNNGKNVIPHADSLSSPPPAPPIYRNCIQLAACAADQILPMNPDLPADLFTSCLTTPIRIALRWFIMQNSKRLLPGITIELIDKIPGQLTDRRTMLGELNWIFTAITDTIAWNVLPKDLFQRLFRQDLLVASLFRNFLLADRIMRSYNCTPISHPRLPPTYHHPMWQAWDLAVDICLNQLPSLLSSCPSSSSSSYRYSCFFSEQLTAFQVWLDFGYRKNEHPEQLPIVLQVLLSQVHRLRALDLLGKFLDLGPKAVNMALSVGIFPYVLKLLQSSALELRPLLVFIWAKILAVDISCQVDLVRENGHKYFLKVLADLSIPSEHRTMAAFIMSCIVKNYLIGQDAALKGNLIALCLEHLNDSNPLLRRWLLIALGLAWDRYESARWCGVRDIAHEKLINLLTDPVPEVRAAAVFALGTFINSSIDRTDHANTIDHSIGITLINTLINDGSSLVRKELVVALQWLIFHFENQFLTVAFQMSEEEKTKDGSRLSPYQTGDMLHAVMSNTPPNSLIQSFRRNGSKDTGKALNSPNTAAHLNVDENLVKTASLNSQPNIKRVSSVNSLSGYHSCSSLGSFAIGNFYVNVWKALLNLADDPHPDVAFMAQKIVDEIKSKLPSQNSALVDSYKESRSDPSLSEPSSPMTTFVMSESPPATNGNGSTLERGEVNIRRHRDRELSESNLTRNINSPGFTPMLPKRYIFGREPSVTINQSDECNHSDDQNSVRPGLVSTKFIEWSSKHFSEPITCYSSFTQDVDIENNLFQEREWRSIRNSRLKKRAKNELLHIDASRLEEQTFFQRSSHQPLSIHFHPYESHLVTTEKDSFSVWLWESFNNVSSDYSSRLSGQTLLGSFSNLNTPPVRISDAQLLNPHDITLLLLASDDGAIKIWKLHDVNESSYQPKLISAFIFSNDMQPSPRSNGLVTYWNQEQGLLVGSGGDLKYIRLWDAASEMKIRDIVTGSDSCVMTISSDGNHLICTGCYDGSVRIFDKRITSNESRVITYREHGNRILAAYLYPDNQKHINVISGSYGGDVRFWDKRLTSSVKTILVSQNMTAMSVHPEADVFACATSLQQSINMYTLDGIPGSVYRHSDGYIYSSRTNYVSSLSFHPFRPYLGACFNESSIAIYSSSYKYN